MEYFCFLLLSVLRTCPAHLALKSHFYRNLSLIKSLTKQILIFFRNFTSEDFDIPSRCFSTFDAVSIIRNEMWAFKGKYFWRIINNGIGSTKKIVLRKHWHKSVKFSEQRTVVNDPVTLSAFWYALPIDQVSFRLPSYFKKNINQLILI